MGEIKAIQTYYKGYKFRSRLEARWAVFFDELGIRYEYEPEGIKLSDGTVYLPDFYLPDFHVFFEVKAKHILETKEEQEAIKKIKDGAYTDSWAGLICFGDPKDNRLRLFCQETDEEGGGSFEAECHFVYSELKEKLYLWIPDSRDRYLFASFDSYGDEIPAINIPQFVELGIAFQGLQEPDRWERAAIKARQARFEYSETP